MSHSQTFNDDYHHLNEKNRRKKKRLFRDVTREKQTVNGGNVRLVYDGCVTADPAAS